MYPLVLPVLQDLYLFNTSPAFTHKILINNQNNLEFVFIFSKVNDLTELLPTDVQLMKVRTVVLVETLHTEEELKVCRQLFPNAQVVEESSRIRRHIVESRGKSRYHPDFLHDFLNVLPCIDTC